MPNKVGPTPDHTPAGKFRKGNKAAHRARGVKKGYKKAETLAAQKAAAEIRQEALAQAKETISASMPSVVTSLRDKALGGDTTAASLLLKHGLPLSSNETRIDGCADLAALAPETRVKAINARVATGELALEHGQMLAAAAREEAQLELLQPLRGFLQDIKTMSAADALQRLVQITDSLPTIEHDMSSFEGGQTTVPLDEESTGYNLDTEDNAPVAHNPEDTQ